MYVFKSNFFNDRDDEYNFLILVVFNLIMTAGLKLYYNSAELSLKLFYELILQQTFK